MALRDGFDACKCQEMPESIEAEVEARFDGTVGELFYKVEDGTEHFLKQPSKFRYDGLDILAKFSPQASRAIKAKQATCLRSAWVSRAKIDESIR